MRKFFKLALALGSALLCFSTAYADHQPTTFVGPTVRGGFTGPFADMAGYSIAGEAGPRNYRVGATLGAKIDYNQRVKLTGEYLWQKINYNFFTGNTKQWVQQGAVGARYEYDLADVMMTPQFDLSAYYSHANNKNLSSIIQSTTTAAVIGTTFTTVTTTLTNDRRIAGSDAGGVSPGVSVVVWPGGRFGVEANYDYVKYHKKYAPSQEAKGWGVTGYFKQLFMENIVLGASASDRQPFNDYEGNIGFTNLDWYGNWTVGLYGNYLDGKKSLPNTWNIGLSIDYILEPCVAPLQGNFKGEIPAAVPDTFLAWVADPAVHMPQVLAIPDEQVPEEITTTLISLCSPAINTGLLADILLPGVFGGAPIPPTLVTGVFAGTPPLSFTVTFVNNAFATNNLVFDPATGIISGSVFNDTDGTLGIVTVTVTATNACGTATTTFQITKPGNSG